MVIFRRYLWHSRYPSSSDDRCFLAPKRVKSLLHLLMTFVSQCCLVFAFFKACQDYRSDTPTRASFVEHRLLCSRTYIYRLIHTTMPLHLRSMARTRQAVHHPHEARFRDLNLPTPELLANTSIADNAHFTQAPPIILTDEEVEQRRRERFLRLIDMAQERYEYTQARRRLQAQRLRHLRDTASKAEDRLEAHRHLTRDLGTELTSRLQQWEKYDNATYDAFIKHFQNVTLATTCMARRYQIVSWFIKDVPRNINRQIERLGRHYSKMAYLVYKVRQANIPLGWAETWHCGQCKLLEDETWSALQHSRGGFGYEEVDMTNGFADYQGRGESVEKVVHLFANFEVRKLRIDHAYREYEPTTHGDLPIDALMERMLEFMGKAMKALRTMLTAAKSGEGGDGAKNVIRVGLRCLKRMEEFEVGLATEMSAMEIDGVPMLTSGDEQESDEAQGSSEIGGSSG